MPFEINIECAASSLNFPRTARAKVAISGQCRCPNLLDDKSTLEHTKAVFVSVKTESLRPSSALA
jgi:hypothetical protein